MQLEFNEQDNRKLDYSYVLLGFMVHQGGSPNSGHYFSIINDRLSDNFFEFNDQRITKAKNINEYYGGKGATVPSAYILFYIRKDSIDELFSKDLKPVDFLFLHECSHEIY